MFPHVDGARYDGNGKPCEPELHKDSRAESVIDYGDSDTFPQGPCEESNGESDTPQHCAGCGCFLENPLTPDGYAYVQTALDVYGATGNGNREILQQWARRYGFHNAGVLRD